jgi:hypothetical protein
MSISGASSEEMSKMETAIDDLFSCLVGDESKCFQEGLQGDEDKASYVEKLKQYTYYQVIVLWCRGNEKAIQEYIDEMWEEWKADNLEM